MTEHAFRLRLRDAVKQGGGLSAIAARVVVDVEPPAERDRLAALARDCAQRYYHVAA